MTTEDLHPCLVCGHLGLSEPARTSESHADESCPACGFEFGYDDDDQRITYDEWRRRWIADGMPWYGGLGPQPDDWDPIVDLARLGLPQRHDFRCPVCGFDALPQPAYDADGRPSLDTCPACGFQFGWTECFDTHDGWRTKWVAAGCRWWSRFGPPPDWSPRRNLQHVD